MRSTPRSARRSHGLSHERLDHRRLERGGDVGHLARVERARSAHVERHRGLDPAEREVRRAVAHLGGGKCNGPGIAPGADPLDRGARLGSRGPGAWRPCRRPRPRRRRASGRSAGSGPARAPGTARCGPGDDEREEREVRRIARGTRRRGPPRWSTPTSGEIARRRWTRPRKQPTRSEPTRPGPRRRRRCPRRCSSSRRRGPALPRRSGPRIMSKGRRVDASLRDDPAAIA